MLSSCNETAKGEQISVAGFGTEQWISAEVPGTVVGAQVGAKVLPDPDYGMNLTKFPGFDANRHSLFSNVDMPADSPYRCAFWFRTEFDSAKDVVIFDLGKLLEGSDISVNSPHSAPGCMSAENDPDCTAVMKALGLPYGKDPGGAQTVFYREPK